MTQRSKSVVLYHLGKRRPRPHPMREHCKWLHGNHPNLDEPGVWLSPNPTMIQIWHFDGTPRKLYAFRVKRSVIKKCGGLKRIDLGTEVWVTEKFWPEVEFLGLVTDHFEPFVQDSVHEDVAAKECRIDFRKAFKKLSPLLFRVLKESK